MTDHLDTRTEDRRNQVHRRWVGLRSQVCRMMHRLRMSSSPEFPEVNAVLAEADRAWAWYLRWDQACVKDAVIEQGKRFAKENPNAT